MAGVTPARSEIGKLVPATVHVACTQFRIILISDTFLVLIGYRNQVILFFYGSAEYSLQFKFSPQEPQVSSVKFIALLQIWSIRYLLRRSPQPKQLNTFALCKNCHVRPSKPFPMCKCHDLSDSSKVMCRRVYKKEALHYRSKFFQQ